MQTSMSAAQSGAQSRSPYDASHAGSPGSLFNIGFLVNWYILDLFKSIKVANLLYYYYYYTFLNTFLLIYLL